MNTTFQRCANFGTLPYLALCFLFCISLIGVQTTWAQAINNAQQGKDGTLVKLRPYEFPTYEQAYGYTRVDGSQDAIQKYWSQEEYDSAVSNPDFEFQKLIYWSDGLQVVTYVYKPKNTPDKQFPTIIFNRGSGIHKDLAPVLVPYMHRLAKEGYVVFAPMYRQSDGSEGMDANGGADLNDLLHMAPLLKSLPYVDTENTFMTGESRGALMTLQAIREGFPMKAAAIWGAFSDIEKLFKASPQLLEYAIKYWEGFNGKDPSEDIKKRSVVYWPEKINTPLLIMHGERDRATPVQHALDLAQSLQAHNRLYSLIIFADDNHILHKNQLERDAQTIAWFKKYNTESEAQIDAWLRTEATERELNRYGYALVERGRITDAVAVFKLFVSRFPENWIPYDGLAETLALNGNTDEAIKNYKIALDLVKDEKQKERILSILADLK
ncbi:prolyl oligopeptidase family serine peptidase [Flavobacteriaceae bacterium 3-367]